MHTHSAASDGADSPAALVGMAADIGLSAIALTDHDTTAGVPEFLAAGAGFAGTDTIPGVEVSVDLFGGEAHIVGLFIDHRDQPLNALLATIRGNRDQRNAEIITKLNAQGYGITLAEVEELAGGESVGRPHFAKILIDKGYFGEPQEVFDELLKRGRPAYCSRRLPTPEEAISAVHAAGGLAIWAHAVYRRDDERAYARKTLEKLLRCGLDGVETRYTSFTPAQAAMMDEFAESYGLLHSGGSDYHGANQPKISLGTGFGDLAVPDEYLPQLLEGVKNARSCARVG